MSQFYISSGSSSAATEVTGQATSVNGSTEDIITVDLGGSAAVYRFEFSVVGRDTSTGDGVTYRVRGSMRTNGTTATEISTEVSNEAEDASLVAADIAFSASGNDAVLSVTGVAGQTITYNAVGSYVAV